MDIKKKSDEVKKTLEEINKSQKYYFKTLKEKMLEKISVVYVIFCIETEEALYVGKTTNLRVRLYNNHLHGKPPTARLKKYLVEDNRDYPNITTIDEAKDWIKENCYFQYSEINDSWKRAHLEGAIGFYLESKYIS